MSIEIHPVTNETECKVTITDTPIEIVNAIRRKLLTGINTFAFKDTTIMKNSSNLDNDMISHRMCLIPVSSECSTTIDCDITNNTNVSMYVTTDHLNKTGWVSPGVLITILRPGQEFQITSTSVPGTGSMHTMWCNITDFCFKQYRNVFFNGILVESNTFIDTTGIDITELKKRIPSLFQENTVSIISNKLIIDSNLFNVINEITDSELITQSLYPKWDISFKTIDNSSGIVTLNSAINGLIAECNNCEYTIKNPMEIHLNHDYSLVHMIIRQYQQLYKYNISGNKHHPLDNYTVIKSNSPTMISDLKMCLVYLHQSLESLVQ